MEYQIHAASLTSEVDFARIHLPLCLSTIQAEVQQLLLETWVEHVNRRDYDGGWDVLPLRCQQLHADTHPILQGFAIQSSDDWVNLPRTLLCPAILELLNRIQCPLKSVRLMRLKAGAIIKPHRDPGLAIEYGEARLHLPVHTSKNVLFTVNSKTVPMRAGELWYINADQVHAVVNRGWEDRINLVIDCNANEWLRKKIAEGIAA